MKSASSRLFSFFVAILLIQVPLAAGEWVSLFDGESLDGWRANESPESWAVEDGAIVAHGERSHLFYVGELASHDFKNFVFEAEVMTEPGANSGIYVHTKFQEEGWPAAGYECQVINSNSSGTEGYVEHKMTGSIYAVRNVWKAPAGDKVWFKYRIRVEGKTIKTFIDDRLVCEYTEPVSPWRPEDKARRILSSGTFALQAHDPGSIVRYRNIKVKLLANDLETPGIAEQDREMDRLLTQFANSNHALIDVGIKAATGEFAEKQAAIGRELGLTIVEANLASTPAELLVVNDRNQAPSVDALKVAKANGFKIVFSSGGDTAVDKARIKARLQAIEAAGLSWEDLWVPGKSQ